MRLLSPSTRPVAHSTGTDLKAGALRLKGRQPSHQWRETMYCQRCRSLMLMAEQNRQGHTEQTRYECPNCGRGELLTRRIQESLHPRHADDPQPPAASRHLLHPG